MNERATNERDILRNLKRDTRRNFLVGGIAALVGGGGLYAMARAGAVDNLAWPFRRVLEFNESLSLALFSESRLAPTFPEGRAAIGDAMRVNGHIGMAAPLAPEAWTLRVDSDRGPTLAFTLADLRPLPRSRMVTELKCIEGWSQVVSWEGVALRDFMAHFQLGTRSGAAPDLRASRRDLYRYVALETPDRSYYVGLDIESAIHPQTLLADTKGGAPLTPDHGAPLRLAIPVKYGIKNIKRIGRIRFTDERPPDYWAERGYDYYAGH